MTERLRTRRDPLRGQSGPLPAKAQLLKKLLLLLPLLLAACKGSEPAGTDPSPSHAAVTATPVATVETPIVSSPTALPEAVITDDDNTPVPAPRRAFASPEYGVQTFLWWRPEIAERDLRLVNDMGFGWVKQTFAWRDIETLEKGKYDWWRPDFIVNAVEEANLKLVVRLDRQPFWTQPEGMPPMENRPPDNLQDYADFCGAVAGRFRGRIAAYQVWNEPNLSREWGEQEPNPAEYTELLRVCFQAIKAADPDAIVISAGLAPTGSGLPIALPATDFLQGMYDAGAAAYFDVLGANAPGYKAPPEVSPDEAAVTPEYGNGRWFAFRHVEDLRDIMVRNGDEEKQVALMEMGWTLDLVNPSYAWHAVTEQEQADYLVRAYQYAAANWSPWIGLMTTIYIADYDWTAEANEQYWWSIVLPDGTPRLAYFALQAMPK